jgi:DNA-binding SARP family transcriptional activator/Tfp pilus assembly protein PilF
VSVRFELLGPLRLVDDSGSPCPISGPQLRVLLAALLLRAGRAISVDDLVEILWDGAPPPGAATTVRAHVKRLRRALGPAGPRLLTRAPGYVIELDERELDLTEFHALSRAGGDAARYGRWDAAREILDRALGLWRGEPLSDIPSETLRGRELPRIEEARLQALEWRIEADLRLGREDQVVQELGELTVRHPLRERFHAQLMLALARCGRRAEALEAYQRARRALVGELGVEPGPELRRLQRQVLAGEGLTGPSPNEAAAQAAPGLAGAAGAPAGSGGARGAASSAPDKPSAAAPDDAAAPAAPARTVPRQLPAAVGHFAGRAHELKVLSGLLDLAALHGGAAVISAVDGTAGIGKTALAVYWAHQHAERFPDGQIYLNLRGYDPSGAPLSAADAARAFLAALGVPDARIPESVEAQLALYRSTLAERRSLVLLDNARDAEQVRPLLPGAGGSLALVTSRSRLAGLVALDGAVPLTLDLLSPAEALELLARRLGAERIERERAAAEELIELCARLPLALNIAAARAALNPAWPLADLVEDLHSSRLGALALGEAAADVRAVISWSYQTLDPRTARVLRLLSLHPGTDISVPTAAAVTGLDPADVRRALNELTAAHLLAEPTPGRYAGHDLLRAFAAEATAARESAEDRDAAVRRLLDHYLHSAHAAGTRLHPGSLLRGLPAVGEGVTVAEFADRAQADAWYAAELGTLVAVTALAAESGFVTHAWRIPWAMAPVLDRKGHRREWTAVSELALAAARRGGDLTGQAHAHRWLGQLLSVGGDQEEAHAHLREAMVQFGAVGDRIHQGNVHLAIARAYARQHRVEDSMDEKRRALETFQQVGHRPGEAQALNAIATGLIEQGEYEQGLEMCERALVLARELGIERGVAATLSGIALAHHKAGRPAEAIAAYRQSADLLRELGDHSRYAQTLVDLGDVHQAAADPDAATAAWREALAILDPLDHPDAVPLRARLG